MQQNDFKAGEALTAERMNTLLRKDRLVYGQGESSEGYAPILTKKAVEDKLAGKYSVGVGAIQSNGLANNAVVTEKIANSAVTKAKIAQSSIDNEKIQCVGLDKEFIDTGEFTGTKFVTLPTVSGKFKNKFMLFLYYGVDNGDKRSAHGVHLFRAYFLYYNAETAKWVAQDSQWHSWSAYGDNNNSDGNARIYIDESGKRLVIETKVNDDLPNGRFYAQGWQFT